MAYRKHELSSLIEVNPKEARARIIAAYVLAKASQRDAARKLDVAENTLIRWIATLNLGPEMKKVRERAAAEGWIHTNNRKGGRTAAPKKPAPKKARARRAA